MQITLKGRGAFFAGSRAGNQLVFRHHPCTAPAVYAADSKDICCENIRVHHAAGMGFLAERVRNVTLKRFDADALTRDGTVLSAAADAAFRQLRREGRFGGPPVLKTRWTTG